MSLINQVLKDLEKRRADEIGRAGGAFNTIQRYTVARSSNNVAVYVFGILAVIMSAMSAVLIWEKLNETSIPTLPTAVESPVEQAEIDIPIASKTMSTASSATSNSSTSLSKALSQQADKPQTVKAKPVAPVETIRPESKNTSTAESRSESKLETPPAENTFISKQPRPLSPKQQAEQAFRKGYEALTRGQTVAAEAALRDALEQSTEHIKAREMLVGIYIKAGRYVEAGRLLFEGIGLNPQYTLYRKLYARVLLEQNNLNTAVKVLEQQPPTIGADPDYYALLAALYQRQGKHENAVALYQEMLKQNQSVGVWWIGLGISLEKMGKPDAARSAYEQARASGTLAAQLAEYTDNRLSALKDIGYPE